MTNEPIFQTLDSLNISYEIQEHKAIFSEEDTKDVVITLEGIDVKNLFVKDKNHNYGLVSMNLHRRADLKKIAAQFGFGRLSFCNPDELMQYLNIKHKSIIVAPLLSAINLAPYLNESIEEVSVGGESGVDARPCNYDWVFHSFTHSATFLVSDEKLTPTLYNFLPSTVKGSG